MAASVTFDGTAATNVVVVSDTELTATVPAGTAGPAVDVTVTTAGGSATLADAFTYYVEGEVVSARPAQIPIKAAAAYTPAERQVQLVWSGFAVDGSYPPVRATLAGTELTMISGSGGTRTFLFEVPAGVLPLPEGPVEVVVYTSTGRATATDVLSSRPSGVLTAASDVDLATDTVLTLDGTWFPEPDAARNTGVRIQVDQGPVLPAGHSAITWVSETQITVDLAEAGVTAPGEHTVTATGFVTDASGSSSGFAMAPSTATFTATDGGA